MRWERRTGASPLARPQAGSYRRRAPTLTRACRFSPMPKTLIAIPTYNESGNVEPLCRKLFEVGLDADILFMDDASPDGTGKIIDRLAAENSRVKVVHRPAKLGIGSGHLDCIGYAYEHDYDLLITMDADFTHPPERLPAVVEKAAGVDVVIGSRYLLRDSLEEWTMFRRMLSRAGHVLTRYVLGLENDASSGLRLYQLRQIPRELFALVDARGYDFFFESLYVLRTNKYRIAEVGIHLPARASGESKMTIKDATNGLFRLGRLRVLGALRPAKYRYRA